MPKRNPEYFGKNAHKDNLLSSVVQAFLIETRALKLKPAEISGKVLVIGPGDVFPERSLLCDRCGDTYGPLRSEITNVVSVDSDALAGPEMYLFASRSWKPQLFWQSGSNYVPKGSINTIDHYCASALIFLDDLPDTVKFQTVLMMRLQQLEEQLPELLMALAPHVFPGGLVIGSGHFKTVPVVNSPWFLQRTVPLESHVLGFESAGVAGRFLGVVYRCQNVR